MTWLADHGNDKTFLTPLLFELFLDAAHPTVATRWTSWDHPVTALGHTWARAPLKLTSCTGNTDDPGVAASFELANSDGSGVAAFAAAIQGSRVTIWAADLDPAGGSVASRTESVVCSGLLGTWEASEDVLVVHVDPFLPWTGIPIPRRPYTTADFPRLDPRA